MRLIPVAAVMVALMVWTASALAAPIVVFQDNFDSYADNAALTAAYDANTLNPGLYDGPTTEPIRGVKSVADHHSAANVLNNHFPAVNTKEDTLWVTYWFYDPAGSGPGATGSASLNGRAGLCLGAYPGGVWGSGGLENYVFIGAYHATSTTHYATRVVNGGTAWAATTAPRSVGWQKFTMELRNGKVNFYHNDVLVGTSPYTEPASGWNCFRLGSPAGATYLNAHYDDIEVKYAKSTVLVDSAGSGDYTRINPAIRGFAVGGENLDGLPPYIVKIKAGSGPYNERITLDDSTTTGNLAGNLIICSDTPGTLVPIALQRSDGQVAGVSSSGIVLHQSLHDITLKDLLLYPSITGETFRRYIIKIDENSANAVFNTITIDNCIITEVGVSGNPLITKRWQAYYPPVEATGSARDNAFSNTVQYWGDTGESLHVVLKNSVLYGPPLASATGANHLRAAFAGQAGESLTIQNTLMAYGPPGHGVRFGQTGAFQGTLTIDGLEIYNSPSTGANHCVIFEGTSVDANERTTATLKNIKLVRDINTDTATRGISGGATVNIQELDKVAISVPDAGIVDITTKPAVWKNLTINCTKPSPNPGEGNALYLVGGAGSITLTDAIFSGAGTKIAGTAPDGGLNVDYAAFAESGADAITARDDGTIAVTYGTHIINADPGFISKLPNTLNLFDVRGEEYAAAGVSGAALTGGGKYVGPEKEWKEFGQVVVTGTSINGLRLAASADTLYFTNTTFPATNQAVYYTTQPLSMSPTWKLLVQDNAMGNSFQGITTDNAGNVYVLGESGTAGTGTLRKFNAAGDLQWLVNPTARLTGLDRLSNGKLIATTFGGQLYTFDPATGAETIAANSGAGNFVRDLVVQRDSVNGNDILWVNRSGRLVRISGGSATNVMDYTNAELWATGSDTTTQVRAGVAFDQLAQSAIYCNRADHVVRVASPGEASLLTQVLGSGNPGIELGNFNEPSDVAIMEIEGHRYLFVTQMGATISIYSDYEVPPASVPEWMMY